MDSWIADIVGKMHIYKITNIDVAKYMGISPQYLSEIINGKKTPKGAYERISSAVDNLISNAKNEKE